MKSKKTSSQSATGSLLFSGVIFVATFAACSMQGHDHSQHDHGDQSAAHSREFAGDPYLLEIDVVSKKPLGSAKKQVVVNYEGRELRFSKEETAAMFRSNPTKYLAVIDEKMAKEQLPFYPVEECVVSGEKLGGDMGEPINLIYKNRLVRLCCKACKKGLSKDPASYIAKLNKATVAKQKGKYPLSTCVVSGQGLGDMGEPIDYVVGHRLLRLCCKSCKKKVARDPLTYLSKFSEVDSEKAHHQQGENHREHGKRGHKDS